MRKWLWTTLLFVPLALGGDFWKEKPSSEWSEKDVQKLLTNSPWAKQVAVNVPGHMGDATNGGPMPGYPGGARAGTADRGAAPTGNVGGNQSPGAGGAPAGSQPGAGYPGGMETGTNTAPAVKVTVRWDSAQPMREVADKVQPALRPQNLQQLSQEFYVITVVGFPITAQGTTQQIGEQLKKDTTLRIKGKDKTPLTPAKVDLAPTPEGVLAVFLFPRSENIGPEDKEVSFESSSGPVRIRTKFKLKEMMYGDKLAI